MQALLKFRGEGVGNAPAAVIGSGTKTRHCPAIDMRERGVSAVPDFQGLMALVGHLLLRWGWLEDRLKGAPVPEDLERVRRIRNAICHRMVAAHADPLGDGIAYITCRFLDGSIAQYSALELDEAIRELELKASRCPR